MAQNKPTAHQCLNLSHKSISHVLLKAHNKDLTSINWQITVADVNNDGLTFDVLRQDSDHTSLRRMLLKLKCQNTTAGGGDAILDGLLLITLVNLDTPTDPNILIDVPVDYIKDPTGP